MSEEMECRKLLLDFYSSEIGTHGSFIVGFSVIMFTLIQIRISEWIKDAVSVWMLYFCICAVGSFFYYLCFRYMTYGTLAHYSARTPWKQSNVDRTMRSQVDFFAEVVKKSAEEHGGIKWVIKHFGARSTRLGVVASILLSLVTTILIAFILDHSSLVDLWKLLCILS